ncbi:MAG: CotH kinase family protein [Kiritimatiellae bacterium]|nr:CotH kinase family protein [Kiritimatiellia bacterium]
MWDSVTSGSTLASSGTLVFTFRANGTSNNGVTVYDASANVLYSAPGLVESSNFSIGENFDFAGSDSGTFSADGFTVDSVEILNSALTAEEVAAKMGGSSDSSSSIDWTVGDTTYTFDLLFRGTSDATFETLGNWYSNKFTVVESEGVAVTNWIAYAESATPGTTVYPGMLLDGDLIEVAADEGGIKNVTAALQEGWNSRIGVKNGVNLTIAHLNKIQKGGGGSAYWVVDETSGISVTDALINQSDKNNFGQFTGHTFDVAGENGVVFNGTIGKNAANAFILHEAGSVAFADVTASGTWTVSATLDLGDAGELAKEVVTRPLVTGTSLSAVTFAKGTIDSLDGAALTEGTVTADSAIGTYELVSSSTGYSVKYVKRASAEASTVVGGVTYYGTLKDIVALAGNGGTVTLYRALTETDSTNCAATFTATETENVYTVSLTKADSAALRISEVMPKAADDELDPNGFASGWIEFRNTSETAWVDLADYRLIRVNRGKKTDTSKFSNLATRLVPPGGYTIVYMTECYPNGPYGVGDDSRFINGGHDGITVESYPDSQYFTDANPVMVFPAKANPKKFPFLRLYYAPGETTLKGSMTSVVDTVIVPDDLPESASILLADAAEGEATKRWICTEPTPGAANGDTADLKRIGPNVGPLYENSTLAKHSNVSAFGRLAPPAKAGEDYTITFSANPVMNPTGAAGAAPRSEDAITAITLEYRIDLTNEVQTIAVDTNTLDTADMVDWGNTYTATIPQSVIDTVEPGHLIQWRFKLTDAEGNEWTSPSFNNDDDGYEWFGTIKEPDATLMSSKLTTMHLFAKPGVADTPGVHDANAMMNLDVDASGYDATQARVAIYDSSTSNYYDYVRIDLRGNSSKDFRKKSHGLRFAKAHPITTYNCITGEMIPEVRKTSFIGEFCDPTEMRQLLAFWFFNRHNSPAPYDFPVRLNLNGQFYQLGFMSQRFNDELIEDCYGLDPLGYGYKNIGPFNGSSTSAGSIEKKTPDDGNESDLDELDEFCAKLPTGVATGSDTYSKVAAKEMDLPAWFNYIALSKITHECDDVWANISGYWDYAKMHDGARGTGTWRPLAYDMNLSFGQWYYNDVYNGQNEHDGPGLVSDWDWFKSHPFYGGFVVRAHRGESGSEVGNANRAYEAIFQNEKFRRLYLRRLRTLMDSELGAPGSDTYETSELPLVVKMREVAELIAEDSALDRETWGQLGYTANGAYEVNVWGTQLPTNLTEAVADVWDNYIVPRRTHLFVTHSVTNDANIVGYGTYYNAGIPESQSAIEDLKAGFSIANATDTDEDGLADTISDSEKVIITNANDEAVDMSGWKLSGRFTMTLPEGTVIDQNGSIIVVVDRLQYVTDYDSEITDDIIIGNAKLDDSTTSLTLSDANDTEVVKVVLPSDVSKYLRFYSFDGIPETDDDNGTGEWITLKNISDSVELDLTGVNIKVGKDTTSPKCNITLAGGTLAAGATITLRAEDFDRAAWVKITNGAIVLQISDANGSIGQSGSVAQKDVAGYANTSSYLQLTSFGSTFGQDDVVLVDPDNPPTLHISEICPKPDALDPNGVEAGWIELYNPGFEDENLSDYMLVAANRGAVIKEIGALPSVVVPAGGYQIVYTTKDYPKEGINDGSTPFITNGFIVAQLKINPKNYPIVQLRKGSDIIDSFLVPVDLPDNQSFAPAGGDWGDYSGEVAESGEEETATVTEIAVAEGDITLDSTVTYDSEGGFYSFANVTGGKQGISIASTLTEAMSTQDMYSVEMTFRLTQNTAGNSENTGMPLFFCRNSGSSSPYSGILAFINGYDGTMKVQIRKEDKSGTTTFDIDSTSDWLDGEWHTLQVCCGQTATSRIAVTVDGTNYVDTVCGVASPLNTTIPMCIGRSYDSSSWSAFTGDIKDLHFYNGDIIPETTPEEEDETDDTVIHDAKTVTRVILPTITPGAENDRTGEVAYGPNAGPLYGLKHKVSDWKAWATASVGIDYPVTLAINPLDDDPTNAIISVKLAYRTDFGTIAFTNMTKGAVDEFEGQLWTSTIPGSAITQAGHLLRWAALVTDASGNTWRTPSFCDPDNAYEWYGTMIDPESLLSDSLQTFHIFADSTALANMDKQYDSIAGSMPYGARVQIYDSQTSNYYDNVRIDLRGNTTAHFNKKSHGIRFIKSQPLTCTNPFTGEVVDGLRKVSFIAEYSDPAFIRQALAFQMFKDMGLMVPYSYPVRLNLNGEFYQMAFHSNRFTDELIKDYYGLDEFGYGYKNVGTFANKTTAGGIEKKTPDDGNEDDLTVLNEFCATFSDAGNITETISDGANGMESEIPAVTKVVVEKFDLPAWLNYLAAAKITQECDDVWANLCAYYDVNGTDTWMPLGYDFNVSLGAIYINDDTNYRNKWYVDRTMANEDNFKSHPLYGGYRIRCHRYQSDSAIAYGNRAIEAVWQSPKFRRLYLRRLRTLMDQQLKAPGTAKVDTPFWTHVESYTNAIAVDAALDRDKWGYGNGTSIYWWPDAMTLDEGIADLWDNYVVPRREHLYVTHSVTNTAKAIGYGRDFNAGIPESQSDISVLKAGFSIVNATETSIDDMEKIVITNANDEVVDMSGWKLTGRFAMTLPPGTVVDANDTITIVVDRKSYIATYDADLTDEVIVGNAGLSTVTTSQKLFNADNVEVLKVEEPSNESKYLRIFAFDGAPVKDDDLGTDEWIMLTNISDTVTLDLAGVNVKAGKDTTDPKCNVTIESGTLAPGGTITLRSEDFGTAKGWEKITNGAIYLQITDANGTIGQTSEAITQKNFPTYRLANAYLQVTTFGATFGEGDLIVVPYPDTTIEVTPGTDVVLEATTYDEATNALANCEIALSAEDEAAGLVTNVLKLVVVDTGSGFAAAVDVDDTKVAAPVIGEITEGETTVEPLTVTQEEGGKKVTVGVTNATVGLWYGFEWASALDGDFADDADSFKRATGASVKLEATPISYTKAFYKVKVTAAKPQ